MQKVTKYEVKPLFKEIMREMKFEVQEKDMERWLIGTLDGEILIKVKLESENVNGILKV